jgi:aryl-alcohol dehydrogenase-like predicted oxidoreductase
MTLCRSIDKSPADALAWLARQPGVTAPMWDLARCQPTRANLAALRSNLAGNSFQLNELSGPAELPRLKHAW